VRCLKFFDGCGDRARGDRPDVPGIVASRRLTAFERCQASSRASTVRTRAATSRSWSPLLLHRARDLLIRQRSSLISAIRAR
jgi:hypothetical protein